MNPILQPVAQRPEVKDRLRERAKRREPRPYRRTHKSWLKLVETEAAPVEKVTD